MDDDTFADERCLEALLTGAARAPEQPSILTTVVRWKDGTLHPMNRPWPRTNARADFVRAVAAGLVPVRSASFVSTLVNRGAVERHGLPHAHYFIWHDDSEFTRRVLNDEHGYLVLDGAARHWTERAGNVVSDARGRFYYKVRNHIWAVRGDAFRGLDAIWGWKSLVVAIRAYVAGSESKLEAIKTVSRGVRDGFLRRRSWRR
jgi:GT2 family glycosyltransferase